MKRSLAVAGGVLAICGGLSAQTTLEDRIKGLELKSAEELPAAGLGLGVGFKDGLHLRTDDGALDFRVGGHVIAHGIFHHHGEEHGLDTLAIKEAHLVLEGKLFERFSIHVAPELAPDNAGKLYEGWVEFDAWGWAKFRAGEFKVPYSREGLEPTTWQDFPENSLADLHSPGRDVGIMVHSELFDGIVDYAFGVYNGNGPVGIDDNSDKDVAGYVGISPLAWLKSDWLRHFRIGFSGTEGRHEGFPDQVPLVPEVPVSGSEIQTNRGGKSPGFATVQEKGDRERIAADLSLGIGPVEFNTQLSRFSTRLRIGGGHSDYRSWTNNWSLGFWLGGTRDALKRPVVDKPLFAGGPGAFQFVARYSTATLDDDFIDDAGFAGAEHVREYSLGVNWYPNAHVRVSLMVSDIRYSKQGIPVGDPLPPAPGRGGAKVPGNDRFAHHTDDEKVLILRVQVDF